MRTWNKVVFEKERIVVDAVREAYQEIVDGRVERYVDATGAELFVDPPLGEACRVIEPEATPTSAVADAGAARDAAVKAERSLAAKISRYRRAIADLMGAVVELKNGATATEATEQMINDAQGLLDE